MKPRHSEEFKKAIIQKISTPGGPTIMQMSEKLGVHHTSIRTWIKLHANLQLEKEWCLLGKEEPEKSIQRQCKNL